MRHTRHIATTISVAALSAALLAGVAEATSAIVLPDAGFAPEGIAADSEGSLYAGSLTQGRIVRIAPDTGSVTEFAAPGANGLVSVVGLHVAGDLVYACSSDPGASALTGTAAPALVAFDRRNGEAAGRYDLPQGGAFCNDIAELLDGTILATDSFAPRIYALRPGSPRLEVWLEDSRFAGEGFNLNGIAHDDGAVYALRYNAGTMHRIEVADDGSAGAVSEIALPAPFRGPDGLTALGDGRFLVVEGGGLNAGARGALTGVRLDGATATVETIAADLDVPTTAVVVGGTAYVVEGQLDHLFDPAAGPASPYRILAIDLPAAYR
jgi:sugar lactone lactonase YvrE